LGKEDKFEWGLNQLPNTHHDDYLKVLNDKVGKYSFLRSQICNTGIVQFFDLGDSTKDSKSQKKDLVVAEKYLLKEITSKEPRRPFLIFIKRDSQVPILFLMLHVITYKDNLRYDFGIMMVNTNVKENDKTPYPIHKWIKELASNSDSVSTDIECEGTFKIFVHRDKLPFRKK
jgi:hypothetical protein